MSYQDAAPSEALFWCVARLSQPSAKKVITFKLTTHKRKKKEVKKLFSGSSCSLESCKLPHAHGVLLHLTLLLKLHEGVMLHREILLLCLYIFLVLVKK